MAHININQNLLGFPGAKYMNLNVGNETKPYVCIPADAEIFNFEKDGKGRVRKVIAKVRLWNRRKEDIKTETSPTHNVKLNLPEELKARMTADMEQRMLAYLQKLSNEDYTTFCIDNFQNKQGTANMPQTLQEAAHWYTSRYFLDLGSAWEDKEKAPQPTETATVATVPTVPGDSSSGYTEPADDLPF